MPYQPEYSGPIAGYVVNFVQKHYWKVESSLTREDVYQEAYIVFMRVVMKYPELETPQQFMALFKSAWYNEFTNLANNDTKLRTFCQMPTVGEAEFEPVGELNNEGGLATLLRQAPEEIKLVLALFLSAPQELLDLALQSWKGGDPRRHDGGSTKLNKMLGLPANLNVIKLTEDYFRPD